MPYRLEVRDKDPPERRSVILTVGRIKFWINSKEAAELTLDVIEDLLTAFQGGSIEELRERIVALGLPDVEEEEPQVAISISPRPLVN